MSESSTSQHSPLDFFQRLLSPGPIPFQQLMFPTSVEDIDKRVNELELVKAWLSASIGTIDLTLQGLSLQRSLLAGGKTVASNAKAKIEDYQQNPAIWAWNMMQNAAKSAGDAASHVMDGAKAKPKRKAAKRSR